MEIVFYFLGIGTVIMFGILMYDTKQSRRLNNILRENKNVQPLFMQRSAEQRLNALNTQLYGNMPTGANTSPSGRVNMNEGARQLVAAQLNKLVSDYNAGQISLKQYNAKLKEMLEMIHEVQGMTFEPIK